MFEIWNHLAAHFLPKHAGWGARQRWGRVQTCIVDSSMPESSMDVVLPHWYQGCLQIRGAKVLFVTIWRLTATLTPTRWTLDD